MATPTGAASSGPVVPNRSFQGNDAEPKALRGAAWVDDATTADEKAGQGTFYREGTPPPLEDDEYARTVLSPHPGRPHDGGALSYDYRYDHVAPPAPIPRIPRATACGMPRRLLWMAAGLTALLTLAVAGVGIGVGVGLKHSPTTTKTADGSSPSEAATSSPTPSAAPPAVPSCPAANGTTHEVVQVRKTFLRVCGVDYSPDGGEAVSLGVVWTASMEDCMMSCAGYPNCTGCGWGLVPGDAGSDHRCWLWSNLRSAHVVRSGWDFAVLL
ncbi:uncharacterized protein UV8b_07154 [Ustilaginoidea virens]|uniref:Apple domain-containing protein n=1 Tax=Ustilaginoidea virens TaxID=1159556 RepID=A0A8E5HX23_USTVR|nr:uncharacterized protein UV8b_07154 [Ustilaginoidea virens]QUC22913.1 hypothetical protein UV8b_07154 [Ustilaginoidea virens]